jgi:AAA15 family ATPase/GTPase
MLIEFRVANYRSIGEEQIMSFTPAAKQKDYPHNILTQGRHKALNALALYGANASGKSNLLKAIQLLDHLLNHSARYNSTTPLPYSPFLLREGYTQKPTQFEIIFILNEQRYRFGVTYNAQRVLSESLYRKHEGREVRLFAREKDIIEVSSGLKGVPKLIDAAIEATRENALFLSICDMFNIEEAKPIFKWFHKMLFVEGTNLQKEALATLQLWQLPAYRTTINAYLALLQLGFSETTVLPKDLKINELQKDNSDNHPWNVEMLHLIYDQNGQPTDQRIRWSLETHESEGTKKAFHLSGPILRTLIEGGILVIDEIEAKMHPVMTANTIELFLNPATNPNHAQLIFATHDTNLLTYAKLRRDQINFVEKNKWESTEIYTLSDFKYVQDNNTLSERMDSDKEKRYLEGRYGAIPILGAFTTKMEQLYGKKR